MNKLPRDFRSTQRWPFILAVAIGVAGVSGWWWAPPTVAVFTRFLGLTLAEKDSVASVVSMIIGLSSLLVSTLLGLVQLRQGQRNSASTATIVRQRERDATERLRVHLGRNERLRRIGDAQTRGLALGVHPAIQPSRGSTGLTAEAAIGNDRAQGIMRPLRAFFGVFGQAAFEDGLPTFVEREKWDDVCAWMRGAREHGGFVLIVGDSCVGKTRLLYEAARQVLPDFSVLVPSLGDGELINSIASASFPLPKLVVWLDEIHRFLDGPYATPGTVPISPATMRRLMECPTPVVVVASIWPERLTQFRATDADPGRGGGGHRPRYPDAMDVLDTRGLSEVSLQTFSISERQRAATLAGWDSRLAEALADRDFNVTEFLAGAQELTLRYERATGAQKAVLHAAVDARRLGLSGPLSASFLCRAARGYLAEVHRDDGWFKPALRNVSRRSGPNDRSTAPLIAVPSPDRSDIVGFTVADYLLQKLSRERRHVRLSEVTWSALVSDAQAPGDLARLVVNVENRLLYTHAETLLRRLAGIGDDSAHERLAELLARQSRLGETLDILQHSGFQNHPIVADGNEARNLADSLARQGRLDEAVEVVRSSASTGDKLSGKWLAELRVRQDRLSELRERADSGDGPAARNLAELLARQGRLPELQVRAASGDGSAARRLSELLAEQNRLDEFRTRAAAGDVSVAVRLGEVLIGMGAVAEALAVVRAGADAGDWFAAGRLVELHTGQGLVGDLAARADGGDWFAARRLVELLAEQGRIEELSTRADAGDWAAARRLSELLITRDRVEEAVRVLRKASDAGDWSASRRLVEVLAGQDRLDALRVSADAGDGSAARRLAEWLARRGHLAELRARADAGDGSAAARLVELLVDQRNLEELRARADAGDRLAARRLVEVLAEEGLVDELRTEIDAGTDFAGECYISVIARTDQAKADRIRKQGFAADGSIAGPQT